MFSKNIFADRLIEIRSGKNLMAKDVADAIGVTKAAISMIESGRNSVSVELLEKLCRCLDCSADYLLGLSDDPERR
jgi:transcriptional regulator with XRE-family HTH domain